MFAADDAMNRYAGAPAGLDDLTRVQVVRAVQLDAIEAERQAAQESFEIEYHEVDKAPFQEAVQPIYDELDDDTAALVDQIRAKSDSSGS